MENVGENKDLQGQKAPFSLNRKLASFVIAISVIGILLSGTAIWKQKSDQMVWRKGALIGKIAMSQNQLISLVREEKLTAFWAGPKANTFYILDASSPNRTVIRYVTTVGGKTSILGASRQIATYKSEKAYTDSIIAATQAGNIGFRNSDGAVVFYAPNRLTNVYMAMPKLRYQIEIYDPIKGQALSLAAITGQISEVSKWQ